MLLSFPEKHGLPEGDGVAQGLPEVGGRGRGGRQVGGRLGFVFTNTLFPETSHLSKYRSLVYCQNTRANYIRRTMDYKSKKDRACSINGERRGGSLAYNILDIRLEWFN